MNRDFLVGAGPLHEREMLRLGIRQLAESERVLREFLASYERTRTPELAKDISEECAFISQTLSALTDMATDGTGRGDFIISGCLLKASRYMHQLIEHAEKVVARPEDIHGNVA